MAQYFTNFSEYTSGVAPSDWTARFVTSNVTYTVQDDGGATGGKVLRAVRTSDARSLLSWNDIDADADRATVQVLIRYRSVTKSGVAQYGGAFVRGSGAAAAESGYAGILSVGAGPTDESRISKYVTGTFSVAGTNSSSWTANTWYWLRFQANGTALKLKRWAGAIGDEPGAWGIEITDSGVSAAGWVGAFIFENNTQEWDIFGVGTNGDAAPSAAGGGGTDYQDSGISPVEVNDSTEQAAAIKRTIRRVL